ncbi:MAG: glycosyltransferase [Longibaculum sp.]
MSMIENSQIKYLIVGFGELEEYLKNLAKQLKVEERVVFAGYRSDVKELLHVVDAFAFPSLQEGLPVSLMEAMAAGLPIVCSRIRGNVDLIEDEKNGYLVEPYDFKGFKNSMEHISSYPLENLKIMNNNIMQNFDIIHVNEKMNEIYSKRD